MGDVVAQFGYSFDQWRRAVEGRVFADPTHVYSKVGVWHGEPISGACVYADDEGQPSCLIGKAAFDLDIRLFRAIRNAERIEDPFGVHEIHDYVDVVVDNRTLLFLGQIQQNQDTGMSWSAALRDAEEYDREYVIKDAWRENEEYDAGEQG